MSNLRGKWSQIQRTQCFGACIHSRTGSAICQCLHLGNIASSLCDLHSSQPDVQCQEVLSCCSAFLEAIRYHPESVLINKVGAPGPLISS